jgi:three-Cys-motif partner protein
MTKDINKGVFDEATKLKLDIFGECFEEWFPVFNYNFTDSICIFDFFAGSGKDVQGNTGSPLVLLDKAKGKDKKYCSNAKKSIRFFFNEGKKRKSQKLEQNVKQYLEACAQENGCNRCTYQYTITNEDFQDIFTNQSVIKILNNPKIGKFILLDQYGFKEINEGIFKQLLEFPNTDFIFFISSSFVKRFREHPNTKKYIDTSKICFENIKPKEIHRSVANYFRDLIPQAKEYYLHHFSIRKEANKGNYYGLIFGSAHTLGMEKFLKVCWKYDACSGEANYDIDNNWGEDSLFAALGENVKKDKIRKEIEEKILSGTIKDNIRGLKYAMYRGCEPKLFIEVVKKLEKEGKVLRLGDVNGQSANIHKTKKYQIERL